MTRPWRPGKTFIWSTESGTHQENGDGWKNMESACMVIINYCGLKGLFVTSQSERMLKMNWCESRTRTLAYSVIPLAFMPCQTLTGTLQNWILPGQTAWDGHWKISWQSPLLNLFTLMIVKSRKQPQRQFALATML